MQFFILPGHENLLALANEDGELVIWNINKKDRFYNRAHYNAIFDLAWQFDQLKLVTASGDHTARLLSISNERIDVEQTYYRHSRSVKSVSFCQEDSWIFATGSRDGNIFVWDTRCKNDTGFRNSIPDNQIFNSHCRKKISNVNTPKRKHYFSKVSGENSVTGMVFQNGKTLISCGAGDGVVKFWDLRKAYSLSKREPIPKHTIPYPGDTKRNGFCNLLLDESGVRLFINCLDNVIYCYNIAGLNTEPIMKYEGHENRTFYIKACLSKDGKYLLSGSSDQFAYIWNTDSHRPIVKLSGHCAEVTCVDWSSNTSLVTCSDDMTHKIWRIGSEILPDNWEVEGRGKAILLDGLKHVKRDLEENYLLECKRRKSCSVCSWDSEAYCENCNYNPRAKKRLLMSATDWRECKKLNFDAENDEKKCKPLEEVLNDNICGVNIDEDEKRCMKKMKLEGSILKEGISFKMRSNVDLELIENWSLNNSSLKEFPSKNCTLKDVSSVSSALKDFELKDIIKKSALKCSSLKSSDLKVSEINNSKLKNFELNDSELEDSELTDLELKNPDLKESEVKDFLTNLPNFALNGEAPHINISPQKKVDKDWLTKMRTEKSLRKRMQELSTEEEISTPKAPRFETTRKTPQRTPTNRNSKRMSMSSPKSPLLRFFKLTNGSSTSTCSNCNKEKSIECTPTKNVISKSVSND